MIELSYSDLELLIALQENPLSSDTHLARIVDISQPTASARLKDLKEKVSLYNVHTHLNPEPLEMEICDTILDVPTIEGFTTLETLFDEHPYTLYRSRVFGRTSGLFIQFRIPRGSLQLIEKLLKILHNKELVSNYKILKRSHNTPSSVYCRTSLVAWNPRTTKWEWESNEWKNNLSNCPKTIPRKPRKESVLNHLSELDVKLLGELTQDARQRNSEIIRKIGLDANSVGLRQKVSRRMKFLKENVVRGYRVFLNWEVFDTYHTFAFICKASNADTAQLYNNLEKNPIPFQSSFVVLDGGYYWQVQSPPSHFSSIASIVLEHSKDRELLILDYKSSEIYGLWPDTFDPTNKSWRTSILEPERIFANVLDKRRVVSIQ